jgi:3-phenylpropionate/trans-cinnamate dioxygenase ferredoxin reductase subunit
MCGFSMISSVAVVGGGQAGATVVQTLRQRGFDGTLTLLCAESVLPYERPPLSKGVVIGEPPVPVLPAEFYVDNAVDVLLQSPVSCVQRRRERPEVVLESGQAFSAEAVVLATGGRPRTINFPGSTLPGVVVLGSLVEAARIHDALPRLRHVLVAGAGFVGTEVAAALSSRGCQVTLVDPVDEPLADKLTPWAARIARRIHDEHGVRLIQDVVAAAEGSHQVERVLTAGGETLPCDLLLVAVGSRPNTEVAERSGLVCTDGIPCDESGRTLMPDVWAAGDVAEWPYPHLGRLRIEHFRTAIDHGQVVAGAMLGETAHPGLVPWFWTDQYDHRFEVAGRPDQGTELIAREDPRGNSRVSLHLRAGRVVGAVGLDAAREVRAATHLIGGGWKVDPSLLADSNLDLRKAALSA